MQSLRDEKVRGEVAGVRGLWEGGNTLKKAGCGFSTHSWMRNSADRRASRHKPRTQSSFQRLIRSVLLSTRAGSQAKDAVCRPSPHVSECEGVWRGLPCVGPSWVPLPSFLPSLPLVSGNQTPWL